MIRGIFDRIRAAMGFNLPGRYVETSCMNLSNGTHCQASLEVTYTEPPGRYNGQLMILFYGAPGNVRPRTFLAQCPGATLAECIDPLEMDATVWMAEL